MNGPRQDRLDELLDSLPRALPPGEDLWPAIQAQLQDRTAQTQERAAELRSIDEPKAPAEGHWRWMRLAAGVMLVVCTSLATFMMTREYLPSRTPAQVVQNTPQSAVQAVPVSFGSQALGSEYIALRSELLEHFQRRMEHLPPQARASLQRSLEDLQRAASEINTILAEHPDDPLLQDLLMSTYQSELQLLADIGGNPGMRVDL